MLIKKLPNLSGAAGVAVLDDGFGRDGGVFGEGLGVLFFAELMHAFELGEEFGALERGLVVAVVVEPWDSVAFVFRGGHGWMWRIGVGELPPCEGVAEVDEAAAGLGFVPRGDGVSVLVDFLSHQSAHAEAHARALRGWGEAAEYPIVFPSLQFRCEKRGKQVFERRGDSW